MDEMDDALVAALRHDARASLSIGLATDTGGGSSFSMLRTMASAYEIGQLRGTALHPAQLMWLATEGSADALKMSGQIGHLGAGAMADITVLDLNEGFRRKQHHIN